MGWLSSVDPAWGWAAAGLVLLIIEVMSVTGFFVSFALAAFVLAVLGWTGIGPSSALGQGVLFASLGVAAVLPIRRLLRRTLDRTPDINQY